MHKPTPYPLDVSVLLPLVRASADDDAIVSLAHVVANNTRALVGWARTNWPDIDPSDPAHPRHAEAADADSHVRKLVAAQDALASACRRYHAATGRDGFAVARRVVEGYGVALADYALRPLEAGVEISADVDALLGVDSPPVPPPTAQQRQAARSAIAEWMLSDPLLDDLNVRLAALLSACGAGGGKDSPGVSTAVQGLRSAVGDLLARGFDGECLQALFNYWHTTTDGPQIAVQVE